MVDDADPDVPSGVADGERGATPLDVSEVASSGFDRRLRACPAAAAAGDVTRLKRARENGCPWDEWASRQAAKGGHPECLKYLHENGCPWDESACKEAAKGGHLECLKYLHENGCEWEERTCEAAAGEGHLECLQYLHENGCPLNEWASAVAAGGGHLECLKYLHENGCEWHEDACAAAAEGGHLECLKYAHENGCPMFGADRYHEIIERDVDGADAVRSYLESIRDPIECPIESVMAKLDEVKTLIPEQTYIEMCNGLMRAKRKRPDE